MIVRFVEAEYSINENGNGQEVCTELAGRSQIPVSVSLVTVDGSATSKLITVNIIVLATVLYMCHTFALQYRHK